MKTILFRPVFSHRLLLAVFLYYLCPVYSFGQTVFPKLPRYDHALQNRQIAYHRNGTFKDYNDINQTTQNQVFNPMHDITSKSLVFLNAAGTGVSGTGFFIKTDPDKLKACLVTSGHNLAGTGIPLPFGFSGGISLSYRVTYKGGQYGYEPAPDWGAGKNLTKDGSVYQNFVPYQLAGQSNVLGVDDYALLLIPKVLIYNKGYVENIIKYVDPADGIPMASFHASKNKTAYVLHHGYGAPQLFTAITTDDRVDVGSVQPNFFSSRITENPLSDGSSGAPLTAPTGGYTFAPVIGIYSNTTVASGRDYFYSLNNTALKNLIKEHCSSSEETTVAPPPAIPPWYILRIRLRKSLQDLIDALGDLTGMRNDPAFAGLTESERQAAYEAASKYKEKTSECLEQANKSTDEVTDAQIQNKIIELDGYRTILAQKISSTVSYCVPPRTALLNPIYDEPIRDAFSNMGSSITEAARNTLEIRGLDMTKPENQTYPEKVSSIPAKGVVKLADLHDHWNSDVTLLADFRSINAIQELINTTCDVHTEVRAKRATDEVTAEIQANESTQTPAIQELKNLYTAIQKASFYMNTFYSNLKGYKSPSVYYFLGVEYFYNSQLDEVGRNSSRNACDDFYQDQINLSRKIRAVLKSEYDLLNANSAAVTNWQTSYNAIEGYINDIITAEKILNNKRNTLDNFKILSLLNQLNNDLGCVKDQINVDKLQKPLGSIEEAKKDAGYFQGAITELINKIDGCLETNAELKADFKDYLFPKATSLLVELSEITRKGEKADVSLWESIKNLALMQSNPLATETHAHHTQIAMSRIKCRMENLGIAFGVPYSAPETRIAARVSTEANPDNLMQAPDELISLRNNVLGLIREVNEKYKTIPPNQSTNKDFFKGVQELYEDYDEYSNLYLIKHYYEDEYEVTDLILTKLSGDMRKIQAINNPNFTNKISVIRDLLDALKARNYPQGFISATENVQATLQYENCAEDFLYFNPITKPSGQWAGLSDYGDSKYVNRTEIAGKASLGEEGHGTWITTRFRLRGNVDIFHVVNNMTSDIKLGNFLAGNNKAMTYGGKFKNESYLTLTSKGVVDYLKLPAAYSDFVPGFQHSYYIRQEDWTPPYAEMDEFVLNSPRTLIYSEAYNRYSGYEPESGITWDYNIYGAQTSVQPYEQVGIMRNYFEQSWKYILTLKIGDIVLGEYKYGITHSDNVNARVGSENISVVTPEVQYSKPSLFPNPAKEYVQVNLPHGYEQSRLILTNVSGTSLGMTIPSEGYKRLINIRNLSTGIYFIQIKAEGKPIQVLKFVKQ